MGHVFVKGISEVDNPVANLRPWCFRRGSCPDLLAEEPEHVFPVTRLRTAGHYHNEPKSGLCLTRPHFLLGTLGQENLKQGSFPNALHAYNPRGAFSSLCHSFFNPVQHFFKNQIYWGDVS